MADLAAALGHVEHHQQPPSIPPRRIPKGIDSVGARAEHLLGLRSKPEPATSPLALTHEPSVQHAASKGLASGLELVPERLERTDQRLVPDGILAREYVLAEHRQQHRAGRGRADGSTTKLFLHPRQTTRPGSSAAPAGPSYDVCMSL